MRAFLATVLSVIAVGVLLIAYGLFNPRVGAARPISPPVRCSRANASDWSTSATRRRTAYPAYAAGIRTCRPPGDGVSGERRAPGADGV